ncbi:MAG: DUF2244 domain-containing protein [Pseudomonadota bacterium]
MSSTSEHPAPDAAGASDRRSHIAEGAVGEPVLFDAVLTPFRSLPPAGFAILMTLVGAVGFMGGVAFLTIGAWPVSGFGVVEVGLFYALFRLNYRSAREFERVRLTREALTVERHDVRGRVQRWSFQPYWLRVQLDEPIEPDTPLTLRSHGKALVIGRFLSPAERLDFANALKAALASLRQ